MTRVYRCRCSMAALLVFAFSLCLSRDCMQGNATWPDFGFMLSASSSGPPDDLILLISLAQPSTHLAWPGAAIAKCERERERILDRKRMRSDPEEAESQHQLAEAVFLWRGEATGTRTEGESSALSAPHVYKQPCTFLLVSSPSPAASSSNSRRPKPPAIINIIPH